jgi:hypothetical protein
MPKSPPAFSPPVWPRLGRRRFDVPAIGGLAAAPMQIPLCWLSQPVRLRLERPANAARIAQNEGSTGRASDTDSIAEYGVYLATATLYSLDGGDAESLASMKVTYGANPRMTSPELVIDLLYRTDDEKRQLLRVQRHQRIQLTGTPPEFPIGASSLIVAGITHEVGISARRLKFTTSPVAGSTPGVPGPWFRLDVSSLNGTDVVPF